MVEKQPANTILDEFHEILQATEVLPNDTEKKDLEKNQKSYNGGIYKNPLCTIGHGGARPGGGMKKGQITKKKLEEKIANEYIRQRVFKAIPNIITAQMNLARGCQYLFKLCKIYDSKSEKWVIPKGAQPKIVKDKDEIMAYLAGDYNDKDDADYYFLTTEKPDNKALDSLLDRTLGKATQKVDLKANLTISDLLNDLDND
jgi:hypothetical protein